MPKNRGGRTLVEQMDVFLPLSNRKIFLFQSFCDDKLKKYEKEFEKAVKENEAAVQKRRKENPDFAEKYDRWSKIYD